MPCKKTGYFVLYPASRGTKFMAGPFPTYASAIPAQQEINNNLARPPFAYIRRSANARITLEWTMAVLTGQSMQPQSQDNQRGQQS